jgi:hypothetical protein
MIQRIQTLYLFLASGAFASTFGLPFLTTPTGNAATTIAALADGQVTPTDNIGLTGLTIMGTVLGLAAIFLYKNRPLQGKLSAFGILLGILTLVLAGFVAKTTMDQLPAGGTINWGLGWAGPVLGMLLSWLAGRGIKADERLVRSMDRLR